MVIVNFGAIVKYVWNSVGSFDARVILRQQEITQRPTTSFKKKKNTRSKFGIGQSVRIRAQHIHNQHSREAAQSCAQTIGNYSRAPFIRARRVGSNEARVQKCVFVCIRCGICTVLWMFVCFWWIVTECALATLSLMCMFANHKCYPFQANTTATGFGVCAQLEMWLMVAYSPQNMAFPYANSVCLLFGLAHWAIPQYCEW